jgi:hypothetical protein
MIILGRIGLVSPVLCVFAITCAAACEDGGVKITSKPDAATANIAAPAMTTAPDTTASAASTATGPTVANLDYVETSWDLNCDAGQHLQDSVKVMVDGTVWCSQSLNGTALASGHLDAPDADLVGMLSSPGLIAKLISPCLLRMADASPYVTTSLAARNTVVTRLVWGTCSDDALASLVAAMRRAGETCVAQVAAAPSN